MADHLRDTIERNLPRRYTIVREIARGGMSWVFLARESHPERLVVLKVMDSKLDQMGRQRFLREVNVTSRLSHPHIVPIFAAGEVDESPYYVMPYIEGDTLADRIRKEGPLPIPEVIRITAEIARGLDYAHGQGIIHRDVKPDNIHFQGSHALVADFGIARALGEAGRGATEHGLILGTVDYMAPEQASDASRVDGRADQYSLACVVFEMLAGEPPFPGKTPHSIIIRHSSEPPPSVRTLRPVVGEGVAQVLHRALQKTPSDRFPDVLSFSRALECAFDAESASPRASVPTDGRRGDRRGRVGRAAGLAVATVVAAVLIAVFVPRAEQANGREYQTTVAVLSPEGQVVGGDASADPDELGDFLANEISNAMTSVPSIGVASYYSTRAIQDRTLTVRQILDALNVDYLVEVRLGLQGDRVSVQVGDLDSDDRQIPGPTWNIQVGEWLDAQPRIAREVVQDFTVRFTTDAQPNLPRQTMASPGQRDLVIGNEFLGRRTPNGITLAVEAYWRAVERDPDYGLAWAKLSQAYALALTYRYDLGLDAYRMAGLAEALASRAVAEAPQDADGYAARSYIRALSGAPTRLAVEDIDRARSLEPNNPAVPSWSARIHALEGNLEEALAEALRGAELDPLHSGRQIAVAFQAFHMGRHEMAVEYAEAALELEPNLMLPRLIKARSLVLLDRPQECLAMELGPHDGTRALCLWASGAEAEAVAVAADLVLRSGTPTREGFTTVIVAEDLAVFYAFTGNEEESLRWIRTAFEQSPTGVELRVLQSGLFDLLRSSAEFRRVIEELRSGLYDRVSAAWSGDLEPQALAELSH
jgi:serine/threonine-protein kinase